MSNIPSDLHYTAEHEWVRVVDANTVVFGITDFAQDALGDIVFVSLPALGESITEGQTCGEVESTKSVSDIYAPVSGTVKTRNDGVETAPEKLNSDPYGTGWLVEVTVDGDAHAIVSGLLTSDAYAAVIA